MDNSCDLCRREAELYHNDNAGLALCEECDMFVDDIADKARLEVKKAVLKAIGHA